MMGLTGGISHVGLHHKGEIHGTTIHIVLWQTHGHQHLKGAVITSRCLTFVHHLFGQSIAKIATLPIPGIAEPPEGYLTANGVLYLAILYGYTGITHGLTLCTDRIADLISLLIVFKLHLERRTLVFLHANGRRTIVYAYCKTSVQQPLR